MSLFKIFDISGSAMTAQSVRLNTVASNIANAEVASGTAEGTYRARHPIFQTVMNQVGKAEGAGVRVLGVVQDDAPPTVRNIPGHPLADEQGNVFFPSVSVVEEMADWISAQSTYRNNVELMSTVKQLMLRTLQIGRR